MSTETSVGSVSPAPQQSITPPRVVPHEPPTRLDAAMERRIARMERRIQDLTVVVHELALKADVPWA